MRIKTLFLMVLMVLVATTGAMAARKGATERDVNKNLVAGPAPNGTLSRSMTIYSTTIDATDSLWWELYTTTDGIVRFMPSSTKAGTAHVIKAGTKSLYVNQATPFLNFSGVTGDLKRQ